MTADQVTQQIAKVESTYLGIEDHGILTAYVHVTYGGSAQGIGGYGFDQWDEVLKRRKGAAFGTEWIRRFLEAAGVDSWEKLPGRTFYVLRAGNGWNAEVLGIRPLPTETGKEFLFADLLAEEVRA